eukprot:GHVU01002881.1.p1 GENE.GHVU01002881.1~~GHVU01002881.1.p1  ORF type:complete len:208 (+),score=14.26 GHVU01002881.1:1254-1877(+)
MMLRTHFGLNEFVKIVNFIAGHGIKVLNGSFAYNAAHSTLKALVDAADRLDILMVFAASNENCDNDNLPTRGCDGYPATFNNRNVMSVCASDYYGDKAYFSSYGKTTVDVCAPGHKVLTTADPKRGEQFFRMGGARTHTQTHAHTSAAPARCLHPCVCLCHTCLRSRLRILFTLWNLLLLAHGRRVGRPHPSRLSRLHRGRGQGNNH